LLSSYYVDDAEIGKLGSCEIVLGANRLIKLPAPLTFMLPVKKHSLAPYWRLWCCSK
jgi:hypothetical protein